ADEPDRVDVEQERGGATIFGGFGIEDMGRPEREARRPDVRRVLVQQVSEVRGRPRRVRDREQHGGEGGYPRGVQVGSADAERLIGKAPVGCLRSTYGRAMIIGIDERKGSRWPTFIVLAVLCG